MKNLLSFVLVCLGLGAVSALAFPLDPTPYTLDNQGDSLEVQKLGDEHYSVTKSSDGYLLVAGEDGVLYYADENGKASSHKARRPEKRSGKENAFLKKLNRKKAFESHLKNSPRRLVRPAGSTKRADWVPTKRESANGISTRILNGAPAVKPLPEFDSHHSYAVRRFPVVLVQNSSVKNVDSTTFHQVLNQENYTDDGYVGSVRDYFIDQSSKMFVPNFDVYSVTIDQAFSSYKGSEYKLVVEIAKALKSNPDFDATLYDADGDGDVDALAILYAGTSAAANSMGGFQFRLQWNASGRQDAGNGIKFNDYFIISQDRYFPGFIHEFSHSMGLSDHYCVYGNDCDGNFASSQYQAPGAHYWDVMATGMYANGRKRPPSYNAFERNFMGWMEYSELEENVDVTVIPPLSTSNTAYIIPVAGKDNEWFILENRQLTRWDATLPAHGLLIWHIDYDKSVWDKDAVNDNPAHQRVDVVEAGDIKVPTYEAGFKAMYFVDDVFPGSQDVTQYGPFTSWDGKSQGITLYNITDNSDGLVCFSLKENVNVNNCDVEEKVTDISVKGQVRIVNNGISTNVYHMDTEKIPKLLGVDLDEFAEKVHYYGVDPDGFLRTSTENELSANYFDKDGYTVFNFLNGDEAVLYAEMDLDMMNIYVINVSDRVKDGDVYTFKQALVYGYNRVNFEVTVTFVDEITSSTSVETESSSSVVVNTSSSVVANSSSSVIPSNVEGSSGSVQGSFETDNTLSAMRMNLNGGVLHIRSTSVDNKVFRLFDSQGRLMMNKAITGQVASVDLRFVGSGVFVAQLVDGSRVQTVKLNLK